MPSSRGGFYSTRFIGNAHLERYRPGHAAVYGVADALAPFRDGPRYLYGWTAAPARVGAAYLGRLFHRTVGGEPVEDHNHPHERRLSSPQRYFAQFVRHNYGNIVRSRRLPHVDDDHLRSGLSYRTHDSQRIVHA